MPQGLSLLSIAALIVLALVLSAALRERAWLRYLFLLRVPLLGIVSLALVAVLGPETSVLAGLLVMQWDGFLALTYFLFLAVWTCGGTA